MEEKRMKVYIDESGDLGYDKGTKWFVISAVIVKEEDEPVIRQKLKEIKSKLNVNEIHIRKIKQFPHRVIIYREIDKTPFTYISVVVDTTKVIKKLPYSTMYNYTCRYLLERVSWYLKENKRIGDIILSSRGTSKDDELIEYVDRLVNSGNNQIKSEYIGKVLAKTAGSWDLLQLADICATGTFLFFEIGKNGFRYPCFYSKLTRHMYRHNEDTIGYGLKYYSDDMRPTNEYMANSHICK